MGATLLESSRWSKGREKQGAREFLAFTALVSAYAHVRFSTCFLNSRGRVPLYACAHVCISESVCFLPSWALAFAATHCMLIGCEFLDTLTH